MPAPRGHSRARRSLGVPVEDAHGRAGAGALGALAAPPRTAQARPAQAKRCRGCNGIGTGDGARPPCSTAFRLRGGATVCRRSRPDGFPRARHRGPDRGAGGRRDHACGWISVDSVVSVGRPVHDTTHRLADGAHASDSPASHTRPDEDDACSAGYRRSHADPLRKAGPTGLAHRGGRRRAPARIRPLRRRLPAADALRRARPRRAGRARAVSCSSLTCGARGLPPASARQRVRRAALVRALVVVAPTEP